MAIIGLYDADMIKYTHVLFNLDLMKLSTYYKNKNHIVQLIPSIDFDKDSKIRYRKDYYDGSYDRHITNEKIEYGGRAFSLDKYIPLPEEIELLKGDRYIYERMRPYFSTNKKMTEIFNRMMRAQHIRLSLDGKNIWDKYESQLVDGLHNKTLILHDYDLGQIPEASDVILDLQKTFRQKSKKYVGMKFPVNTYSAEELIKWAQFYPMGQFYYLRYNGVMEDEELVHFYQRSLGTSMLEQTEYVVSYGCKTIQDFVDKLPQIFRQIVYLQKRKKKILLKYDEDFLGPEWTKVMELIHCYYFLPFNVEKERFDRFKDFNSMYSFVWYFYKDIDYKVHWPAAMVERMPQSDAREIFKFVQKNCYPLFCEFYECHDVRLQGGKLVSC